MNENNNRTSYFLITVLSLISGFSLLLVFLHSPDIREPLPDQGDVQSSESSLDQKNDIEEEIEDKKEEKSEKEEEKKELSKKDPLSEKAFDKLRNKIDDIADE